MNRRSFLGGMAALGLNGCAYRARTGAKIPPLPRYDAVPKLMPVRADVDRIFRITVCLRPFRAAGPRLDVETVGAKTVITITATAAAAGPCLGVRAASPLRRP